MMKYYKITKIKVIILILITPIIICTYIYIKDTSYGLVKKGISMKEAESLVLEDSSYYIVRVDSIGIGKGFECLSGEYKGKYVRILGNKSPSFTCSNEIEYVDNNSFLIKAKKIEDKNVEDIYYPTELDLYCESYEFITPIHRDYTYSKHGRMFYPKEYIDEYDALHNDYKK